MQVNPQEYHILLADDDADDCDFFQEALDELPVTAFLQTVGNGAQLMEHLLNGPLTALPDVLFLDLNMPLISGAECLSLIKAQPALRKLPVIIFSTSLNLPDADALYANGALHYIQKPGDFTQLKKMILHAIQQVTKNIDGHTERHHFIINPTNLSTIEYE